MILRFVYDSWCHINMYYNCGQDFSVLPESFPFQHCTKDESGFVFPVWYTTVYKSVYQELVDSWVLYDNSGPTPRLIDSGDILTVKADFNSIISGY